MKDSAMNISLADTTMAGSSVIDTSKLMPKIKVLHQALNTWLPVTPGRQALGKCGCLPQGLPKGEVAEGSLNMEWKEPPFLFQGAAYYIESLGRDPGWLQ